MLGLSTSTPPGPDSVLTIDHLGPVYAHPAWSRFNFNYRPLLGWVQWSISLCLYASAKRERNLALAGTHQR
jgi:hypothetical protein